jgi:hypothetical protein
MHFTAGKDEKKARTGKRFICWGFFGLVAIIVVWGTFLSISNDPTVGGQTLPNWPGAL